MLRRTGWFDTAVEIDVDAFGHALAATRVFIHPDSDMKDSAGNRKNSAECALTSWEEGRYELTLTCELAKSPGTEQQRFFNLVANDFPKTFHDVKESLNRGENVVAVVARQAWAACGAYSSTENPLMAGLALQEAMVRLTGVPVPIDAEGQRRFIFLAWKSTDSFDSPSQIGLVAVPNSNDAALHCNQPLPGMAGTASDELN